MKFRVGALLVAILAVAATPTFAQVTGTVKAGVNFSKAVFEEDGEEFSSDFKPGFVVGAGVDVPIAEMFSFAPEILYSMKGGKNGDLSEGSGIDVKLKIDQVQIPMLFKAKFAPMGTAARPFVSFGPAVGFTTSAKIEAEGFDEDDIKDDVETVDFSGIIGVGIEFGRGIIEYRYDHGFRDLDKDSASEAKPRTHTILFGFGFGG
jgi:hypothetical protein